MLNNTKPIIENNDSARQTLLIVSCLVALIILISSVVNSLELFNIFIRMLSWGSSMILAIMIQRVCEFIKIFSGKNNLHIVPYLIIISPVLFSFDLFFASSQLGNPEIAVVFFYSIFFLSFLIQTVTFYLVVYELKVATRIVSKTKIEKQTNESETQNSPERIQETDTILGNGNATLDRIITSIISRKSASAKRVKWTTFGIVVIVILGIGASYGTFALNEVKKVQELEVERERMIRLSEKILTQDSILQGIKSPVILVDSAQLARFNRNFKTVIEARYGDVKSYKDLLTSIEKQANVSWPDIAMRVTVAALTIFLVQILFNIYKYDQQQVSHLDSKAEALELYKDEGANHDELRSGLLSKIESQSKFDKGPATPTDLLSRTSG